MSDIGELRKKSVQDLIEDIKVLKQEQMNLRFQKAYGQLGSSARMRVVRRQIARIIMLINENKRSGVRNAKA